MPASIQPRRDAPQPRPSGGDTRPRAQARPASASGHGPRPPARPRKRRGRQLWRLFKTVTIVVLILALVSLGTFWYWVDSRIIHTDALSGAANTPGETYLIVGSDSRDGWKDDGVVGQRSDTIVVLHKPVEGPAALISIPRDSYVEIPGHGKNKINAAFAYGGPALLVETIERLTGLTVDRYLEVGFTGVTEVVKALGGVELCYDRDVNDEKSHLRWEAGCHVVGGKTALAFARMRYADPLGDIGRTDRQRQLASAVAGQASDPALLRDPLKVVRVASAGLDSVRVSDGTGAIQLAQALLDLKAATGGDAVTGTPPIATIDYRVEGIGSCVLLDPEKLDAFWRKIAAGKFKPGADVGGLN